MANRAYKFRIYPNNEQMILFARTFGCVRMVYNHWLNRRIRQYKKNKTNITYTVCAKEMAEMKKTEEYAFLREVDIYPYSNHSDTLIQHFRTFSNGRKQDFQGSNQKRIIKTAIQPYVSMTTSPYRMGI